jgi:hypothetical protein
MCNVMELPSCVVCNGVSPSCVVCNCVAIMCTV